MGQYLLDHAGLPGAGRPIGSAAGGWGWGRGGHRAHVRAHGVGQARGPRARQWRSSKALAVPPPGEGQCHGERPGREQGAAEEPIDIRLSAARPRSASGGLPAGGAFGLTVRAATEGGVLVVKGGFRAVAHRGATWDPALIGVPTAGLSGTVLQVAHFAGEFYDEIERVSCQRGAC